MTGINDVAQAVGLSTATVSRALRGLPGVSTETRQRIEAAARELHYVPSRAAAGLASGHTHDIAVLVPYMTRWYFASVTDGAASVLNETGYGMLLYHLAGDPVARRRLMSGPVLRKRVDAVLLLGLRPTDEEADLLRQTLPVGLVGSQVSGFPSVSIDDLVAARQATDHLVSLGHTRIGYIGGEALPGYQFATPRERRRGYRNGLMAGGLRHDPALETSGQFTMAGGAAACGRLLALPDPPTAIFAASDEMAFGATQMARERGFSVPGDLSIVGIDDHDMAEHFNLTTVRQPVLEMGQMAARQLLARLGGDTSDSEVVVDTQLVIRGTTAPPAASRLSATS